MLLVYNNSKTYDYCDTSATFYEDNKQRLKVQTF